MVHPTKIDFDVVLSYPYTCMIAVCQLHMLKRARYRFLKKSIVLYFKQMWNFVDPVEVQAKLQHSSKRIFDDAQFTKMND